MLLLIIINVIFCWNVWDIIFIYNNSQNSYIWWILIKILWKKNCKILWGKRIKLHLKIFQHITRKYIFIFEKKKKENFHPWWPLKIGSNLFRKKIPRKIHFYKLLLSSVGNWRHNLLNFEIRKSFTLRRKLLNSGDQFHSPSNVAPTKVNRK